VVASYGGSYSLDEVDSAMRYLVTHSTYVYLIDGHGRVRHLYGSLDDAAAIAAGVRQLLAAASNAAGSRHVQALETPGVIGYE
jgi:cytochrome oxidase Cu insertion factor (SCO1/SenC/PrrC family)